MTPIPTDYMPKIVTRYERGQGNPKFAVPKTVYWLEWGARGIESAGVWKDGTNYSIPSRPPAPKRERPPADAEEEIALAAVSPARKVAARALTDLGNSTQQTIGRVVEQLIKQCPDKAADKANITERLIKLANNPQTQFAKEIQAAGNDLSKANMVKIVAAAQNVFKPKKTVSHR